MSKHKARGGGAGKENNPGKGDGSTGEPEVPKSGETKKTKPKEYQRDLPEESDEADEKTESFKKGGSTKKMKAGGHAEGKKAHGRPDRKERARGGRAMGGAAEKTGGRSPFTEANKLKTPGSGKVGQGHEGDGDQGRELAE